MGLSLHKVLDGLNCLKWLCEERDVLSNQQSHAEEKVSSMTEL